MPRNLPRLLLLALASAVATPAPPAEARSEKTLAYVRDQVWPTAVRFLVVDERLTIGDKDAEAGYVLFQLREDGKTFRGSLEVMTVVVEGRANVRFVIQIEDRPSWVEIAMLQRLERKLRAEHGAPSPRPTKPTPAPPKDPPPEHAPRPDDGGPPISPTP